MGLAYLLGKMTTTRGESSIQYCRKPVWPGMVLGVVCLVWSAYHGCQMLEGDLERYRTFVWILVPVTTVLSYFYLDYINARVLGGFMTLCANHLICGAFAYDVPGRSFYSIVCLLLGIVGMVGIGLPWRYRDTIRLCARNDHARMAIAGVLVVFGCVLFVMPIFARM